MPTVNVNHVLYHRYEPWSQQFQAGAGPTASDHGTGGMAMLGYGQRYAWNDVFEVGGLFSVINRPYDGDREPICVCSSTSLSASRRV
jgi:biofilm PGA synthesis protein PgaA